MRAFAEDPPLWVDAELPRRWRVRYNGTVAAFPRADTAQGLLRLLRAAQVTYQLVLVGLDGDEFGWPVKKKQLAGVRKIAE